MKRVVHAFLTVQAPRADEEEAIGEIELCPRFWLRSRSKDGRVDAVGDYVDTRRIEAMRTARVGNLLLGGHDRLAVAEDSPVSLGEVASRKPDEPALLTDYVARSPPRT